MKYYIGITLLLIFGLSSCTTTRNAKESSDYALSPGEGQKELVVMDFSAPPSLNPIENGWEEQSFVWHKPMEMSFVEKESKKAIRLKTKDSASILLRKVNINLQEFPVLNWEWFVEKPISTKVNENSIEGDDHPIRIVIYLEDMSNEEKIIEIVWGNYLEAGNYIFVDGYKHFVARGGEKNTGKWFQETVNLARLYQNIYLEEPEARITDIGLFSDSDDTNGETIAYVSKVSLKKN